MMMTFSHVATVLRDSRFAPLHSTSRLILVILADMANDQGECWQSQVTIAESAGVSLETAKRAMRLLRELGYISSRQLNHSSNVYQLNLHLPAWEGATETRLVPAPQPEPDAPVEAPSSPTDASNTVEAGGGQGEEAESPSQAPLGTSMPVEATEPVEAPAAPDPDKILLSEAAHLIMDTLPSVAWELGDTATIKQVAYQLQRLQAIGLSQRKIKELTAGWPDFVANPAGFVLSQLQQLEQEHAGSRMDARQAQRQADTVERPRLTDRELAEERDRQRRRREAILAEQERLIVAREQADKHARLQREAEEAAAKAAAGELGVPKIDEDPEAAAKIRSLALSY